MVAAGVGAALAASGAMAATLTVYESRMPDGSIVVGDRPTQGAKSVTNHRYEYTPGDKAHIAAEREYWRREARAFDERFRMNYGSGGQRGYRAAVRPVDGDGYYSPDWQGAYYHGGGRPLVPHRFVPSTYTSSPGAVNGRGAGFIGSGFSTSR